MFKIKRHTSSVVGFFFEGKQCDFFHMLRLSRTFDGSMKIPIANYSNKNESIFNVIVDLLC